MKTTSIHNYLFGISSLAIAFLLLIMVSACTKSSTAELTAAQKMAKKWKVQSATINGQPTNDFANLTLTFQADASGNPTAYTVVTGGVKFSPSFRTDGNGNWVLEGGNAYVVLDKATGNENRLQINFTDNRLTVKWKSPKTQDKTEPDIELVLVPA
jgi:Lipocalin-like domain